MSDEGTEKNVSANMLAMESEPRIDIPDITPEAEPAVEQAPEPEPQPRVEKEVPAARPAVVQQASAPAPVAAPAPAKDKILKEVEDILSNGLGEIYTNLPDAKKSAFRQKGEEVAMTIRQMFVTGKVKVHTILDAIRGWLRMIPGINKFFLEQEAKIKTDRVLAYGEKMKSQSHNQM